MKLSIKDFKIISTRGIFYYAPSEGLKLTDYYRQNPGLWCFKVFKKEVFKFLHWNIFCRSHKDTDTSFPEFNNKNQAELFLFIAIKLHNEQETRVQ